MQLLDPKSLGGIQIPDANLMARSADDAMPPLFKGKIEYTLSMTLECPCITRDGVENGHDSVRVSPCNEIICHGDTHWLGSVLRAKLQFCRFWADKPWLPPAFIIHQGDNTS